MAAITLEYPQRVERWSVFEASMQTPGHTGVNPFTDCIICGTFANGHESVTADGFYDGDGIYRVRFMPSFTGEYRFTVKFAVKRDHAEEYGRAETAEGRFTVLPASENNHGLVRINGNHFVYEDGEPFFPVGTTCYAWTGQSGDTQEKTLKTLAGGYFNKVRMCLFPKHYLHNLHEPATYPYEGTPCRFSGEITGNFMSLMRVQPGNDWDFTRFNPVHFRNFENRVLQLGEMGIQADIILFHAYDRWGFSQMTPAQNNLYIRYVVARLAAYRNVWWSMANEYDLLRHLTIADWEILASTVYSHDPYNHLRSIHNCFSHYDHSRPWITHCSIQREDVYKCAEQTDEFRIRYKKPVVLDEIGYEGNIDQGWGNLSGKELLRRFWEAACRGGYASHGETYLNHDTLWWSHGGQLFGESHPRLKFLHDEILGKIPGHGLKKLNLTWDDVTATIDSLVPSGFYLIYYGFFRPSYRDFFFDEECGYRVELIDTWEMTITDMGVRKGAFRIPMPGKEYMAIRITKVS